MNVVLRITAGPGTGTCRVLNLGQRTVVGSTPDCDWRLDAESAGDAQFACELTRLGCWVENSSDSEGLKLNGVLTNRRKLCDGDIISIGPWSFIARIRGQLSHLQKQNVPLVGTDEFAKHFARGIAGKPSGSWTRSTHQNSVISPWRKTLPGQ